MKYNIGTTLIHKLDGVFCRVVSKATFTSLQHMDNHVEFLPIRGRTSFVVSYANLEMYRFTRINDLTQIEKLIWRID